MEATAFRPPAGMSAGVVFHRYQRTVIDEAFVMRDSLIAEKGIAVMKKLSEFADTIGASRSDLTNWFTRLDLRTKYADTVAGSARRYTVENVLELGLINAYVRAGVLPQIAVAMADATVRAFLSGSKIREWAVIAAGNHQTGRMADSLDEISFDELTKAQPNQVPVFSVVRVGEIVRRVETLFSGEGEHG